VSCSEWVKAAPETPVRVVVGTAEKDGRGRDWIILQGREPHTLQQLFEKAKSLGDGCIAGKFADDLMIAIVHRNPERRDYAVIVPEACKVVETTPTGRFGKKAVQGMIESFMKAESIGNIKVHTEVLLLSDVITHLPIGDPMRMLEYVANAKQAKKNGVATKLQEAVCNMQTEVKTFAKMMRGNLSIKDLSQIARTYPESFPHWVDDLVGFYYDMESKTLKEINLKTVLTSEETWYMEYTIVFAGLSESGKSNLGDAVGRYLAEAHSFSNVVITKGSLGAFGLMTKANTMQTVGAFMFHDCKLEAYKDKPLSSEEKKGLWKVDEDASFLAPHGMATILKFVPRIVTCNSGGTAERPDYGWWFKKQGMKMAAKLARKDVAKLQNLSGEQEAQIRHFIIFHIDRKLYVPGPDAASERKKRFESRVK